MKVRPFHIFAPFLLFFAALASAPVFAEPVELRLALDREVLPSAAKEKAVVKISLESARAERPGPRAPVNLALVIDRSGSMGGTRIDNARAAAIEAVRRLSGGDIVSVVAFDSSVETLVPATLAAKNRQDIEDIIGRIKATGTTALYAGVSEGAAQVRKNRESSGFTHRVLLLSDGMANVGPRTPEALGELGVKLAGEGISVSTVGLGNGYDEDLMTRLALTSDGNTYFAKHASELAGIFDTELGDVLNVVARSIRVTIHFPKGARPLRFIGREGVIRGQDAEFAVNQVYGGQEKFSLIEVEIAAGQDDERRDIATASVSYEDAGTSEKRTRTAAASARFSADKQAVIASANHEVQADYAEAVIAKSKDEAIALSDAKKTKEAAARLREAARDMKRLGETYGNKEVIELGESGDKISVRIEQEGIDNLSRKQMRTDNAKAKNQQGKISPQTKSP